MECNGFCQYGDDSEKICGTVYRVRGKYYKSKMCNDSGRETSGNQENA